MALLLFGKYVVIEVGGVVVGGKFVVAGGVLLFSVVGGCGVAYCFMVERERVVLGELGDEELAGRAEWLKKW